MGSQELLNTEINKIFKIEDKDINFDVFSFISEFNDQIKNSTDKDLKNFLLSKI